MCQFKFCLATQHSGSTPRLPCGGKVLVMMNSIPVSFVTSLFLWQISQKCFIFQKRHENAVQETAFLRLESAFICAVSKRTHNANLCIIQYWHLIFICNTISNFCTFFISKWKITLFILLLHVPLLLVLSFFNKALVQFVFITWYEKNHQHISPVFGIVLFIIDSVLVIVSDRNPNLTSFET